MIILVSDSREVFDKLPLENKRKVALIPNAKDSYDTRKLSIIKQKLFLEEKGLKVKIVDLNKLKRSKLYKELSKYEIIYVMGGNSFVLLEKIRKSGFDKILDKLLTKGVIYIGQSAGACVMGYSIEPTQLLDFPKYAHLENYDGLGYVNLVILPHYKDPKYNTAIKEIEKKYSKKFKLKKLTDSEGLIVENDKVRRL